MLAATSALGGIIKDAKKLTPARITSTAEQVLPNGITIFDNESTFAQISNVTASYPNIRTDQSTTIDVPEKD